MFVLKILSPAALWLAIFLGSGRGGQSAVLFHWEAENHLSPILVRDREVWHVAVCGATRTGHNRATEQHQPILGVNPAPLPFTLNDSALKWEQRWGLAWGVTAQEEKDPDMR